MYNQSKDKVMKIWTKYELVRIMAAEQDPAVRHIMITEYIRKTEEQFTALLQSRIPGKVNCLGNNRYYIS